jgi:hypothetical protein
VSFAAITPCVASQRVSVAVVYFVMVSVRKLLDTNRMISALCVHVVHFVQGRRKCHFSYVPEFLDPCSLAGISANFAFHSRKSFKLNVPLRISSKLLLYMHANRGKGTQKTGHVPE